MCRRRRYVGKRAGLIRDMDGKSLAEMILWGIFDIYCSNYGFRLESVLQ